MATAIELLPSEQIKSLKEELTTVKEENRMKTNALRETSQALMNASFQATKGGAPESFKQVLTDAHAIVIDALA